VRGSPHKKIGRRAIPMKHLKKSRESDQGDVPGWVLITLMTAGLVVVMWAMAGPALGDVFTNAIDRVLSI
jgi:hypothetical protein